MTAANASALACVIDAGDEGVGETAYCEQARPWPFTCPCGSMSTCSRFSPDLALDLSRRQVR